MATLSHSPVRVARVALASAQAALPLHASKYSRHDGLTLPQLAACLVLRAFWRTSLRGAQAQLADSAEVREALHLPHVPSHNALWRAHRALQPQHLERLLEETVHLGLRAGALAPGPRGAAAATDSTGLTQSRTSQWASHQKPTRYWRSRARRRRAGLRVARAKRKPKRTWHFPKWSCTLDTRSQLLLAQAARRGPFPDAQDFLPLLFDAHRLRPSALALADAGFDSNANFQLPEECLGTHVLMRLRLPRATRHVRSPYRRRLRVHFPHRRYAQRNCAESAFSAHKRRFGDLTPSRSWTGRLTDTLLHGVLHNCALLIAA